MIEIIVILAVLVLAFYVGRKNVRTRQEEFCKTLEFALEDFKKEYRALTSKQLENFKYSLSDNEDAFVEYVMGEDNFVCENMWTSQQSIIMVQDLMVKLNESKR